MKRKYDGSCSLVLLGMSDGEIDSFFKEKANEGVSEATPWFDDGPGMRAKINPDGSLEHIATGYIYEPGGIVITRSIEDYESGGYQVVDNRSSFARGMF